MSDRVRPSVIFFTNSDHGQSNVVLATLYELLREDLLDIHVASWVSLQHRIEELIDQVRRDNPAKNISSIQFHDLADAPGIAALLKARGKKNKADVPHPPGRLGAERIELLTARALTAWEPEQHLSMVTWAGELIRQIDPALVVVDPFLIPAHDAARHVKAKYAVLSPCSLGEGLIPQQSTLAQWTTYPA